MVGIYNVILFSVLVVYTVLIELLNFKITFCYTRKANALPTRTYIYIIII